VLELKLELKRVKCESDSESAHLDNVSNGVDANVLAVKAEPGAEPGAEESESESSAPEPLFEERTVGQRWKCKVCPGCILSEPLEAEALVSSDNRTIGLSSLTLY
jgi:hypothetical protein